MPVNNTAENENYRLNIGTICASKDIFQKSVFFNTKDENWKAKGLHLSFESII